MNKSLCLAVTVLLAACGDIEGVSGPPSALDTEGTNAPATLAAPVDGARAAAALFGFINDTGGFVVGEDLSGDGKATTTQSCDSGSRTFTSDDTTPNADDGRVQFDNCVDITLQNGVEVMREVRNGVRRDRCLDAIASSTCQDANYVAGEEGRPLSLEVITGSSDLRLLALAGGRENVSGDRFINGAVQYDNLLSHRSASIVFDQMFLLSDVPSGNRAVQIGGDYALNDMARTTASCLSGRLTVATLTPLSIDANNNIVGGQLRFTSTNGGTAVVTFQSNRSVTSSVNGGTSTTFSPGQVASFCSIQ
jgi:hypothetical protein